MKLKKLLITLIKVTVSVAILGYIFYKAVDSPKTADSPSGWEALVAMLQQPKHWGILSGAVGIMLVSVVITLLRWWYLVRAVGIDASVPDAMRIGFLGCLFNLAPTGIVGGDLIKAWMLARENRTTPGNRAKALASVIVDRIIGLYVLFLVAAAGVFITGFWSDPDKTAHRICWAVLAAAVVSTVGIALVLYPGFLEGPLVRWVSRIPKIGPAIDSLLDVIRIYRDRRLVLFVTALMTIPVHCLLTVSLFLLAVGLGFHGAHWWDYFAIYPISSIAQTIPLPAGPTESGIVFFYKIAWLRATQQGVSVASAKLQGVILAFAYRLSTFVVVPIGAAYFFLGGRREVTEVLHEAEAQQVPGDETVLSGKPALG